MLTLEEHPFNCDNIELPKEKPEQMIDQLMNHTEVPPTHLTTTNLLSPAIDTSHVDTVSPTFQPCILPLA